jgi:hypothetical protein
MTTKEKYELIDKSQVSEKLLTILQNMEKSSKNFTDEAVNSRVDSALDKIIEGFKAKKPEALRTITEAKKEVKKEKEKAIKKNEGKDFSDKKDTDDKTGLPKKDTLEERKEIIKKESETEKEARERAKKELEKENEKAKDEIESQIEKLNRLILEDPALRGFNTGTAATGGGKSTPIIDAERKALPRGSRVSKKGWKNQYGASDGGRKYWENRENRSDRKSPEYETGKPYLEKGGSIYDGMSEREFLKNYYGVNVFTENPSDYFDIKKLSSANDNKIDNFIEELKKDGYVVKKKSYSGFTSVMGVKRKMSHGGYMADGGKRNKYDVIYNSYDQKTGDIIAKNESIYVMANSISEAKNKAMTMLEEGSRDEDFTIVRVNSMMVKGGYMADGGEIEEGKYYVLDAKDGKIVSKGFDTEEEAKVEKFKIFEKTDNFFLTQKKMSRGGGIAFKNFGKTKGRFKLTYEDGGEKQSEIWSSLEEATSSARRYSSPKLGYTNVHIYDEHGKEYFFADGGETDANYDGWDMSNGKVTLNGNLVTYYDFDRDADAFFISSVSGGGQKGFREKVDVYKYLTENSNLSKYAKGGVIKAKKISDLNYIEIFEKIPLGIGDTFATILPKNPEGGKIKYGLIINDIIDGQKSKNYFIIDLDDKYYSDERKSLKSTIRSPYSYSDNDKFEAIDEGNHLLVISIEGTRKQGLIDLIYKTYINLRNKNVIMVGETDLPLDYPHRFRNDFNFVVFKGAISDLMSVAQSIESSFYFEGAKLYKEPTPYIMRIIWNIPAILDFEDEVKTPATYIPIFEVADEIKPKTSKKYAEGGEVEGVDLFEDYDDQPEEVQAILANYDMEDNDYETMQNLKAELESIGYTFDFGLDAEPYDLRKIGQVGKSEFYAKGGMMADGGETEGERLSMGESVYFEVFNDDGKDGIIKFRNDGSNIIEAMIAGDIRGFRPKRYMSYLTKKDLQGYLNRDFNYVEEVDEDYVQNIISQEAENKPSDVIVVKFPYPEIADSPEQVTIIKKGDQVFDYNPINGDFKTIFISLDYDGVDLDEFLEDSVKIPLEKLSPETLQIIEIIKENESVYTIVNELQTKGLIKNYVELAEGGEVDFSEKLEKMRNSYNLLEMKVKARIASAIGIDDAIRIMGNDYAFHPFDLITSAVRSGLLELDEINRDLVYSALMEAENVTEDYRDSGQGIGSSDMTYFTKNVLDGAGYKTGFISNRLKRVDEKGNELVIDKYEMEF